MPWSTVGNIRGPAGPQGNEGPQGPQGNPGSVGPAGLQWRGAWSNSNTYVINDVVVWGGSSYWATANKAAGQPPPTGTSGDPGTDDTAVNAGWALLTMQGAQGIQGNTGSQGPAGNDGAPGSPGSPGTRGSQWYTGTGAPGVIGGSIPGDKYLDLSSGDVYNLT